MKISIIAPGTTANLKVLHDGNEKMVDVKLGELPERRLMQASTARMADRRALWMALRWTRNSQVAREMKISPNVHGVVVTDVDQGSAAFNAGLREGDVVMEVNRKP